MKSKPASGGADAQDEIAKLVSRLIETEQRLLELTQGEVDAFLDASGRSYLMRQTQEKLLQSEAAQRQLADIQVSILNALPANIALIDNTGVIVAVNDGWRQFAGTNALQDSAAGVGQNYLKICEGGDDARAKEAHKVAAGIRSVLNGAARNFELEYPCHSPAEQRWFRLLVAPLHETRLAGAVVMHLDITERRRAEQELVRSNRALKMLSSGNEKLIRAQNETQLLNDLCRVAVELGGYRMAWVGYAQDDPERTIQPVAHAGEVAGYFDEVKIYWDEHRPTGRGPAGRTIRDGQAVVCEDLNQDEILSPWAQQAQQRGYRAMVCLPLRAEGKTFGLLGLYSAEVNRPDAGEMKLLQELADDLAFGIGTLRAAEKRRQTEQALRESENKFSKIFQSSPVAIALSTLDEGRYLDVNDEFLKMVQRSRHEVIGHTSLELGIWDGAEQRAAHVATLKRTGAVRNVELDIRGQRGQLTRVLWSADAVVIGGISYLLGLARDITEWKRVEARLRRLVDSNAQAVFFWNTKGEITGGNSAFLKITGYTREDLAAGRINWTAMTPPEYSDRDQRALAELAMSGICAPYEKEWIRKDGRLVPILLGAAMFEDNREEGVMFVLDLTDRKKLEEQFRQIQKMEAIGQLAGGVAHDFNNILAIIQMQVGLLKTESGITPGQLNYANDIEKSAERAANLTRQLLLFSRKQIMRPRDLDLKEVITNISKMLRRIVGEDVQMQFKFFPEPLLFNGDAGMVDQILLNLTVNARDAMPEGGQIMIETNAIEFDADSAAQSPQGRAGAFVCVSVTDTGHGIAPEILPRIFEPFFTTKDVGKGTGLGLATVFGIMQQHQGWVTVYSEVGKGTTFRVYFPRRRGVASQKTLPAPPPFLRGGDETILLVEDDISLRLSIRTVLSRLGYRILEAADGNSALEAWKQNQGAIHLLLTDMVMPDGMNGKKLAELLMRENPRLKVIYTSGYSADIAGKDLPLEEGLNFLAKPFETHKLAQTVRNCLDRH